jgi:dGTPase
MENESDILKGDFSVSLMDKSQYKAQISDIINISVKNIYQSKEVIEKEIIGYKVIHTLLDVFTNAYINTSNNSATNSDKLIMNILPEKYKSNKETMYDKLLNICQFVSLLTDGKAIEIYKIINATKI